MKRVHISEEDHILIGLGILLCFGLPTGLILGPLVVVLASRTPSVLLYITCITLALTTFGLIIGIWGIRRVGKNRAKRTEEFMERLKSISTNS